MRAAKLNPKYMAVAISIAILQIQGIAMAQSGLDARAIIEANTTRTNSRDDKNVLSSGFKTYMAFQYVLEEATAGLVELSESDINIIGGALSDRSYIADAAKILKEACNHFQTNGYDGSDVVYLGRAKNLANEAEMRSRDLFVLGKYGELSEDAKLIVNKFINNFHDYMDATQITTNYEEVAKLAPDYILASYERTCQSLDESLERKLNDKSIFGTEVKVEIE